MCVCDNDLALPRVHALALYSLKTSGFRSTLSADLIVQIHQGNSNRNPNPVLVSPNFGGSAQIPNLQWPGGKKMATLFVGSWVMWENPFLTTRRSSTAGLTQTAKPHSAPTPARCPHECPAAQRPSGSDSGGRSLLGECCSYACGSKLGVQNGTLVDENQELKHTVPWWFHFDPYPYVHGFFMVVHGLVHGFWACP